jgi:hypothetical protein
MGLVGAGRAGLVLRLTRHNEPQHDVDERAHAAQRQKNKRQPGYQRINLYIAAYSARNAGNPSVIPAPHQSLFRGVHRYLSFSILVCSILP